MELKKFSPAFLARATKLSYEQMNAIRGGVCALRCDQDVDIDDYDQGVEDGDIIEVGDCSRETAQGNCESLENAVCVC